MIHICPSGALRFALSVRRRRRGMRCCCHQQWFRVHMKPKTKSQSFWWIERFRGREPFYVVRSFAFFFLFSTSPMIVTWSENFKQSFYIFWHWVVKSDFFIVSRLEEIKRNKDLKLGIDAKLIKVSIIDREIGLKLNILAMKIAERGCRNSLDSLNFLQLARRYSVRLVLIANLSPH